MAQEPGDLTPTATLSPDRRYVWTGTDWSPASYSADGAWVWDGTAWCAVPPQAPAGGFLGLPAQLMEFDFDVGTAELHRVHFRYDQTGGRVVISVDGLPVVDEVRLVSLTTKKSYRFTVGVQEQHQVHIQKARKVLLAGARPQTAKVWIDGRLIGAYQGDSWLEQ
jgi:hypothetical protein